MTNFATSSIIIITIIIIIMIVMSVSFRIIDIHINKLSKLCHIRTKTVITGGGYSNAKTVYDYQTTWATYLKIHVNENKEVSHCKMLV